ncbi:MAG: bifunctional phosphopantothenoylcysteine decarboxylase/phosphopantothenate--cysteine ligase CoaBC [Flavobacteriales bacterium]|nr:bifunctional phosphopantothenoylcysteine decarboxylase/phosphopantothenate--cysteine ligase CoaBC [Flavobacteriales bacterium]MCB9448014.1 bifunctional phosphopantothenoylcysteine decarboxylase/phosphopantothenate--cysteine ligase CoaBC [Flavobacteriales bacterium]
MSLRNKHIVLGVTGSIAAYKAAFLVRLLVKEGVSVQVVMTDAAKDFITPLTLSTLSGKPVLNRFSDEDGNWNSHVKLGMEADLVLIAPATANILAKMANGVCDNLLLAVILSSRAPVAVAPAMDLDMYRHPATKHNLETLLQRGTHIIDVESGELASGLIGEGRMAEPEHILQWIRNFFGGHTTLNLSGKNVLVTAGPTREAIDPVRFLSNHSSGKMGYALAEEAAKAGAQVTLISGPTALHTVHPNIRRIDVETAKDMLAACEEQFPAADLTFMAAAVADYAPAQSSEEKLKKQGTEMQLRLVENPDILAHLGEKKQKHQILVGFALETNNEEANAQKKLMAKKLDFIVLNSLRDEAAGFGTDTNKVTILGAGGSKESYPLKPKQEVAADILNHVINHTYDTVA